MTKLNGKICRKLAIASRCRYDYIRHIMSFLAHCETEEDAQNSIAQLRKTCPHCWSNR